MRHREKVHIKPGSTILPYRNGPFEKYHASITLGAVKIFNPPSVIFERYLIELFYSPSF